MADAGYYDEDEDSLLRQAVTLSLTPLRILTSRPAIKAYLSTILFVTTSTILLTVSSTAYAFFYYNYIPQINLEKVLYLQYGSAAGGAVQRPYPYATTALDTTALISGQAYDVEVKLDMPRSEINLAAGNFMLDLSLLAPKSLAPEAMLGWLGNSSALQTEDVLHRSRRPAILPYASSILKLSHTVLHLPWHLLGVRDLDRSVMVVPMFEMLTFARGSKNVPTHARLEVQSESVLQVYDARLAFRAKFQGLRWAVYNYRVASFLLFTTLFYLVSVTTLAIGWALISRLWADRNAGAERLRIKTEGDRTKSIKAEGGEPSSAATPKVKTEEDTESSAHGGLSLANVSDTPAQYPTSRGRQPLSYSGQPVSAEATTRSGNAEEERLRSPMGADEAADDEDEGDLLEEEEDIRGRPFDSGIGTSMESEHTGAGVVRRRSSRGSGKR
ncbi:hypothetical protein H2200_005294 [Cladophialophora chaetospira]|uniref:Adipose-regulatory protein-domain-containing protein n=1 Tax=Cladophialophora chaetospira TaxID=386627 RepID=A0AA39CJG5_9EURO|nr:hypothetical protein H2200_005294 [Cladophialophora chaetospira]